MIAAVPLLLRSQRARNEGQRNMLWIIGYNLAIRQMYLFYFCLTIFGHFLFFYYRYNDIEFPLKKDMSLQHNIPFLLS